jgi:hypothetical protein
VQLLADSGQSEGDRHDFKLNLPDAKNLTKVARARLQTPTVVSLLSASANATAIISQSKELILIKSFLESLPTRSGVLPPLQSSGQFQFEFRKPRS